MKVSFFFLLAFCVVSNAACAAIIVGYRGDDPNILEPYLPNPSQGGLDIDNDGAFDLFFGTDGGLLAVMQSRGETRFISSLSAPPNRGGKVRPVSSGSIIGGDTSNLSGDWYSHTDNGGASGFGLSFLQFEDTYIGVELEIEGNTHYGWVEYVGFSNTKFVANRNIPGGFINSWAYESEPDTPIAAGAIPEPSALSLFLLGGLLALHRRR
ncbi:MAG: hypothetical protein ACI9NQ_000470 [Paracoccaceae bacterium]|jgi:hypothetical protein